MSNELGWKRIFRRINAEQSKVMAARLLAKRLPPNLSTKSQIKTKVKAPNRAGKKRIQNSEFPNQEIMTDIQDVSGGTER